jgi:DNA adenine methylase
MRDASPLRYPGGKWRVSGFFERLLHLNGLEDCHYVEAYAGGASLALSLLFNNRVGEIHLNDLDPAIHAFWFAIIHQKKDFIQKLELTPVTAAEWHRQRDIYSDPTSETLSLGFATFFLNRTNFSGILNGGMIGGLLQSGKWKLDARFNREELRKRIERVHSQRSRIHLSRKDAIDYVRTTELGEDCLIYLDPPYYRKGQRLYHNSYEAEDHREVSEAVLDLNTRWVVSYDDVPETRRLYQSVRSRKLSLLHTARNSRLGSEVMFFSDQLRIPRL